MDSLVDLVDKSERKALLKTRKTAFEKMVGEESYQIRCDNVIIMNGAKPNETELQTAEKFELPWKVVLT